MTDWRLQEPSHLRIQGVPGGSDRKESACNAGEPGSGRSPGEGNGKPLQYSCLENPMDRGAWWATVRKESDMTEQLTLSLSHFIYNRERGKGHSMAPINGRAELLTGF